MYECINYNNINKSVETNLESFKTTKVTKYKTPKMGLVDTKIVNSTANVINKVEERLKIFL